MTTFTHLKLQTPRLSLRPLMLADAAAVLQVFTDAKFMEFATFPTFKAIDEARALVTRDICAMASGERIRLGLERLEDGALLGVCTLFNLDMPSRKAEVGYGLVGSAIGCGYMCEALSALLDYGFHNMNLNRVHAEIDPVNKNSVKSLERLGFNREGVLRENCIANGIVSDSSVYGLLQREWFKRHADLRRGRV